MTTVDGWSVFTSPPAATLTHITGRVRPGDVDVVFEYVVAQLHKIERAVVGWCWGWAYRPIRGSSVISRHALGNAFDWNAPAHPLGVRGTWSAAEKAEIHAMLRELEGVVRWGEDYSGRVDGMHFEINASPAAVKRVADRIRRGELKGQQPPWKPSHAKALHFGRVQEQFLIAVGAQRGEVQRLNGVGLVQDLLDRLYPELDLVSDGIVGERTLNALGRFEAEHGGGGRPRVPDRTSIEAAARKARWDLVGEPWDDYKGEARRGRKGGQR